MYGGGGISHAYASGMATKENRQRYVLASLVALSVFYVSFATQWIEISTRDKTFNEYTTRIVQVAANEYRPTKDVRALLLVKADELSMPLRYDEIDIAGMGRTLRVGVHYEDEIMFPGLNRPLYRMKFDHNFAPGMLQ